MSREDNEVQAIDQSQSSSLLPANNVISVTPNGIRNDPILDALKETKKRKRPQRKSSNFQVVLTYIVLATITVNFTITCPCTILWQEIIPKSSDFLTEDDIENDYVDVELNQTLLVHVILVFVLVLSSFFYVNLSDPGYLSKEVMEKLDQADHYTVNSIYDDDTEALFHQQEGDNLLSSTNKKSTEHGMIELQSLPKDSTIHSSSNEHNNIRESQHAQQVYSDDLNNNCPSSFGNANNTTRRKYCEKCNFYPPLRSHHCKICDKCVATFDHHCGFIGTCIGERNHCRFYWFLTFQLIGFLKCGSIINSTSIHPLQMLFNFLTSPSSTSKMSTTVTQSLLKKSILPVSEKYAWVLFIFVFIVKWWINLLLLMAGLMWIAHSVFAITNLTTFEAGKGPKHIDYLEGTKQCDLPFSRSLFWNLKVFCFAKSSTKNRIIKKRTSDRARIKRCCFTNSSTVSNIEWVPIIWKRPSRIIRDSDDLWEHPWQNKYYSCC